MLGELSGVAKFFLVTGYTDMRKSIDGLMAIVRDTYELDPYSNSLFLFCGRRCDRIKALHFEKDGFCLYYKRLDNGRFQWPRDPSEVRNLTRQEYRWLLEGLSIDQPKAIRLSFVQKGENSPCFCRMGKTPPAAYPHENGTGRISGDNSLPFLQTTVCVWKTQHFSLSMRF